MASYCSFGRNNENYIIKSILLVEWENWMINEFWSDSLLNRGVINSPKNSFNKHYAVFFLFKSTIISISSFFSNNGNFTIFMLQLSNRCVALRMTKSLKIATKIRIFSLIVSTGLRYNFNFPWFRTQTMRKMHKRIIKLHIFQGTKRAKLSTKIGKF